MARNMVFVGLRSVMVEDQLIEFIEEYGRMHRGRTLEVFYDKDGKETDQLVEIRAALTLPARIRYDLTYPTPSWDTYIQL